MGLYSRLKRAFRSETYIRVPETGDDANEALTFVSDLVTGQYTEKTNWRNLLKVAWEDPIANRICVTLSKNVFDDWFVIKKLDTDLDAEDGAMVEHEQNAQIQEEFERMQAKAAFTQALIAMRIFGRSFQIFNFNLHRDDYENGYQVATLDIFTEENTTIPMEAYDSTTGIPDYIVVQPNSAYQGDKLQIKWYDVLLWCVDPKGRSVEGYSAMYPVWDLMTYLREDIDAMVWAIKKFGLGVWLWLFKGGLDDATYDKLESTLKNMSGRRAVTAEEDTVSSVEWKGPPAGSISGVVEASDFILGIIASGSSIPKDIFTGVSAGAITGSEINNKALYATISKIQSDITPYVLETIRRMGYDTDGMVIEWNVRYATDELEQAQIRLLQAQAAQLEMQAERGTDFQIGFQQQQQDGEDMQQNQNPTGVQS